MVGVGACFMSCAFQTADHICIVCAGSLWAKKKKNSPTARTAAQTADAP